MRDTRGGVLCWLILALPLVAVGLWLVVLGTGYGTLRMLEGWAAALAFAGFVTLAARWRALGSVSWATMWLLYVAGLVVTLADALAWYFQGSSFSVRFFANVRLDNLSTGIHAFPGVAALVIVVLFGMLGLSGWLISRVARTQRRKTPRMGIRAGWLVVLVVIAALMPSAWQRFGGFFVHYHEDESLAQTLTPADERLLASPDPVSRNVVRASPGKNLVIIYMESLERIYTDDKIFPGLTPNLDQWRKRGLDYPDFLTYTGADYTIAALFASQCGVPYLPSPERGLGLGGNNGNSSGFQPSLACLGDVLHAAGYSQVFMEGANLKFADKGVFLRMHGFNQALGLKQIEKAHGHKLPAPGWGLYDSDLFRLATVKFKQLAASEQPFNLDVLTVDTHPQHGRPSPGCPKYAANPDPTIQAVHCTDYLVGKFLDAISKSPVWKNTVVVVMSDHQSLPNSAWQFYPKSYRRRPLLFILNAGQGKRTMRFYHMDIAPTVLHLLGVRTNATFLAGANRSASDAPGSPLVDDPADVAVLRQALWDRAEPLMLCKDDVLVGKADNGVRIGGFQVPMLWRGRERVALWSHGAWLIQIGDHSVHGVVVNKFHEDAYLAQDPAASAGAAQTAQAGPGALHYDIGGIPVLEQARASGTPVLLITPRRGSNPARQFSVDWIGKAGGLTHLANVPRLRGLEVASPHCTTLVKRMNTLQAGKTLDLSGQFKVATAPLHPPVPDVVWFNKPDVLPYERGLGWLKPETWGSFSAGDDATLGFTLPSDHCHAMDYAFKVHPFIHPMRPALDVQVYANGTLMTTWKFGKQDMAQTWHWVTSPVRTSDPQCRVHLRFAFSRPGASPPPYPKDADPRPLQLLFLSMQPAASAGQTVADR